MAFNKGNSYKKTYAYAEKKRTEEQAARWTKKSPEELRKSAKSYMTSGILLVVGGAMVFIYNYFIGAVAIGLGVYYIFSSRYCDKVAKEKESR